MELIDRLKTIKALDEAKIRTTSEEYDRILDVIGSMPTIEEHKTGIWKAKDFHTCYCTNCNFAFDIMKCDFIIQMRFCPNCGAKME